MKKAIGGTVWALLYLLVALGPLFFMLVGDPPPSRGWLVDLSVGLGFVGLAMMGLQFALTARFNAVDASYGLDVVLLFHRQISFVATAFILAHPVLLIIDDPATVRLLNVFDAGWQARFGVLSVLLVIAIVVQSLWRRQLRLSYEVWRLTHGLLALGIIATALLHIELAGYYVSGPWRRGLWIAMSLAILGLLVYVRLVEPWRALRRPWLVRSVEPLPGGAWNLRLEADGHDGLRFAPGQFAWLTIERSPFSNKEHPFSISSSAERPHEVRVTIKELGDFTSEIGEVAEGTRAYLDGPYGAFSFERGQAEGFVFLAGGIGVTPMLSMLHTMRDRGDPRPVLLFYANPTWEDTSVREELDGLSAVMDLEVVHVLEDPPDGWEGPSGLITEDLLAQRLPDRTSRFNYFVCGPDAMMAAVEDALTDRGVPLSQQYYERFDFID